MSTKPPFSGVTTDDLISDSAGQVLVTAPGGLDQETADLFGRVSVLNQAMQTAISATASPAFGAGPWRAMLQDSTIFVPYSDSTQTITSNDTGARYATMLAAHVLGIGVGTSPLQMADAVIRAAGQYAQTVPQEATGLDACMAAPTFLCKLMLQLPLIQFHLGVIDAASQKSFLGAPPCRSVGHDPSKLILQRLSYIVILPAFIGSTAAGNTPEYANLVASFVSRIRAA